MNRLSRRSFLRGAGGIAVGLPFLESLVPRTARAAPGDVAKRFVAFFECNGVNMDKFFPSTPYGSLTSASFTGTSLAPLAGLESKIIVPRGVCKVPLGFNQGGQTPVGCDHQNGMGGKLTAQQLIGADHYANGISVDQYMAARINPSARPSMTLQVGRKANGVTGVISYSGAGTPVQGENNPWLVFKDFMAIAPTGPTTAERIYNRQKSVLDVVKSEMDSLKSKSLSAADKTKLDLHYTSIRELEMAMVEMGLPACSFPDARRSQIEAMTAVDSEANYKAIGEMQMDVLALALACGNTKVATLQWATGAGGPTFKWDGLNHQYHHHAISHNSTTDGGSNTGVGGPDYKQLLFEIDTWYAKQYRYLLNKLSSYTEADGKTVLDNSAVVWMNELSDGLEHNFMDMPYVIAGGCGGYLKTGQYVRLTKQQNNKQNQDAPHNKLLTTLINAVGIRENGQLVNNFGAFGQTGEFTELKA